MGFNSGFKGLMINMEMNSAFPVIITRNTQPRSVLLVPYLCCFILRTGLCCDNSFFFFPEGTWLDSRPSNIYCYSVPFMSIFCKTVTVHNMKVHREVEVQHHSFSGYFQITDWVFFTKPELKCVPRIIIGTTPLGGSWPPRKAYTKIN